MATETTNSILPIGQQPEGDLDSLKKLEDAVKSLMKNIDELQANLKKLTEENKRLKDLVGIVETASAEGRELI
jgi:cell shape-determining protein MreC